MAKRKRTKGPIMIYKAIHRNLMIEQLRTPLKTGDELMCSAIMKRKFKQ
jgi:hypothetical protein